MKCTFIISIFIFFAGAVTALSPHQLKELTERGNADPIHFSILALLGSDIPTPTAIRFDIQAPGEWYSKISDDIRHLLPSDHPINVVPITSTEPFPTFTTTLPTTTGGYGTDDSLITGSEPSSIHVVNVTGTAKTLITHPSPTSPHVVTFTGTLERPEPETTEAVTFTSTSVPIGIATKTRHSTKIVVATTTRYREFKSITDSPRTTSPGKTTDIADSPPFESTVSPGLKTTEPKSTNTGKPTGGRSKGDTAKDEKKSLGTHSTADIKALAAVLWVSVGAGFLLFG